jgi:hypothetical protein
MNNPGVDTTWEVQRAATYTILELNCAILAASMLAFKPLFKVLFGKKTATGSSGYTPNKSPAGTGLNSWEARSKTGDFNVGVPSPPIHGYADVEGMAGRTDGDSVGDNIPLEHTVTGDGRSENLERFPSDDGRWGSSHSIIRSG